MKQSIEQLLKTAEQQLTAVSDSPRLDAEVLLSTVLKKDRSYFRAFPEVVPDEHQQQTFQTLLAKRCDGQPIAHITGSREFWSLDLSVNEHTLIPRADTEILIEFILEQFPENKLSVADLGTGTGAIALALASEKPGWDITATDRSNQALKIAQDNAEQLALNNIHFKAGSWFDAINRQEFDLIVSNPPYIAAKDPHLSQGDVRFEPVSALASGDDGLDDIRLLIAEAAKYLKPNGWLILEHGYDQKEAVKQLFEDRGYQRITQRNDYGNNPRMTAGKRPA